MEPIPLPSLGTEIHAFGRLHCSFGFENNRRQNLFLLDENTLLFAVGNAVVIYDIALGRQTFVRRFKAAGSSAIALHPHRHCFAVAEKGESPNIYIYSYPDLQEYKVLREGTASYYCALTFNNTGTKLASVGGDPDYMMTVWDWENEAMLLKNKAFSQDVFKVYFSPIIEGRILTSGTGHIKFWKMAATFTGLKLQGELGKFGKSELSDIAGFVELPDGRVLSGSETGIMLLWDENIVKREFFRHEGVPCHEGQLQAIHLENGELITGGDDGVVRVWAYEDIDQADQMANDRIAEIEPRLEIRIGDLDEPVKIRGMLKGYGNEWLVHDGCGAIWRLDLETGQADKVMRFHAGKITGLDVSPKRYLTGSTAEDGAVIVYNFAKAQLLSSSRFNAPGSCLTWCPITSDPTGSSLVAGFGDGVVRVLTYTKNGLELGQAMKPHTARVTAVQYSPNGLFLATAGEDNLIWFLNVRRLEHAPLGFVRTPAPVQCMSWSEDSTDLLVTLQKGLILEITCPHPTEFEKKSSDTFELINVPIREYHFKRKPKPKPEPKVEAKKEENDFEKSPEQIKAEEEERDRLKKEEDERKRIEEEKLRFPNMPLVAVRVAGTKDQFYVTLDGKGKDDEALPYLYLCQMGQEHPLQELPFHHQPCQAVSYSAQRTFLLSGSFDGTVHVRLVNKFEHYWRVHQHDRDVGKLTYLRTSHDERFLLSVGEDGNFFVNMIDTADHLLHPENFPAESVPVTPRDVRPESAYGDRPATAAPMLDLTEPEKAVAAAEPQGDAAAAAAGSAQAASRPSSAVVHSAASGSRPASAVPKEAPPAATPAATPAPPAAPAVPAVAGAVAGAAPAPILDIPDEEPAPPLAAPAPDIVAAAAYSFEEEKVKAEQDKILQAAELKKEAVRKELRALREEFVKLVRRNKQAPTEEQLTRDEMRIDKMLVAQINAITEKKKADVFSELAWVSESKEMQLQKLKRHYLEDVAVERIEVRAIREEFAVSTFPLRKLSEASQERIRALHATVAAEERLQRAQLQPGDDHDPRPKPAGATLEAPNVGARQGSLLKRTFSAGASTNNLHDSSKKNRFSSKLEEKSRRRKARAHEWATFESVRPGSRDEPSDAERIRRAEKSMGDFPLKTSADYSVPEHLRINTEKKRRESILLEESYYNMKAEFNAKVLALRHLKESRLAWIEEANSRVVEINKILGKEEELLRPKFANSEKPENRFIYDKAALLKYQKEQAKPAPGRNAKQEQDDEEDEATSVKGGKSQQKEQHAPPPSELEQEEQAALHRRLRWEKQTLLDRIDDSVAKFDEEVRQLRAERFQADGDFKVIDLKLLVLRQELEILKEFEKEDVSLAEKLNSKRQEKSEFGRKIEDLQEKITQKNAEVETVTAVTDDLAKEFGRMVAGQPDAIVEALKKIYNRSVKKKFKEGGAPAGGDFNADDGGSSEDEFEFNEDEDDEADEDVRPPECDKKLYERILELRERRLSQEELKNDYKRAADTMKKDMDTLVKKEKIVSNALTSTEAELQELQKQKQDKLNAIDVVLTLKMHQLKTSSLADALVFSDDQLARLSSRVEQINNELKELNDSRKGLHKEIVALAKDRVAKKATNKQLEAKAVEVQLLKFGQVINLEALEQKSVNKPAQELRDKLVREDASRMRELAHLEAEITNCKEELTKVTVDNTRLLQRLADLTGDLHGLEHSLDSSPHALVGEYAGISAKERQQNQRLIELAMQQAQDIDALKAELLAFKSKGGNFYTH